MCCSALVLAMTLVHTNLLFSLNHRADGNAQGTGFDDTGLWQNCNLGCGPVAMAKIPPARFSPCI